jgi:hypothetical protein
LGPHVSLRFSDLINSNLGGHLARWRSPTKKTRDEIQVAHKSLTPKFRTAQPAGLSKKIYRHATHVCLN